jgi:hypothetical protein
MYGCESATGDAVFLELSREVPCGSIFPDDKFAKGSSNTLRSFVYFSLETQVGTGFNQVRFDRTTFDQLIVAFA